MDLHLLTLIRTKGRRPLHPFSLFQTPNFLQAIPSALQDWRWLGSPPNPTPPVCQKGKNLKTLWGRKWGQTGRQQCVQPLVSIENGALSKETWVSDSPGAVNGEVTEKTSFPEKMDPLCRILGEWLGVPKIPKGSALGTRFGGGKRVQTLLTYHFFVQLLYLSSPLRRDHENRNYLVTSCCSGFSLLTYWWFISLAF